MSYYTTPKPRTGTKVGTVGVDSGQIMIIDPCYAFSDDYGAGGPYDEACAVTLATPGHGGIAALTANKDAGFVTGTLYGDGEYPIYADLDKNGQIVSMTIYFDDDLFTENEEDES